MGQLESGFRLGSAAKGQELGLGVGLGLGLGFRLPCGAARVSVRGAAELMVLLSIA